MRREEHAVNIPPEIVAAFAALLGAIAYAIRKVVTMRASPEEEARVLTLQAVRDALREIRQVKGMMSRCHGCAWAEGDVPKAYDERIERLRLEIERDATRRRGGRGGSP